MKETKVGDPNPFTPQSWTSGLSRVRCGLAFHSSRSKGGGEGSMNPMTDAEPYTEPGQPASPVRGRNFAPPPSLCSFDEPHPDGQGGVADGGNRLPDPARVSRSRRELARGRQQAEHRSEE